MRCASGSAASPAAALCRGERECQAGRFTEFLRPLCSEPLHSTEMVCALQGCDGSILLDGDDSEKFALPNKNSVRGFEVIDAIKASLEDACPGVVSCADIVALAAYYGIVFSGGPTYDIVFGRKYGLVANQSGANNNGLPSPFEPIDSIIQKFNDVGLNTTDMVALSGAHTIGVVRCALFGNRLSNFSATSSVDPTLDAGMAASLQRLRDGSDGNQTSELDVSYLDDYFANGNNYFDNGYYRNLLTQKGLLSSDQGLFSSPEGVAITNDLMGNIALTGSDGEIRKICRVVN
ncbi:Peroxidase N [Dichanthelium oligosanthes]|uniref:Peroxidase n=1 Tax=Dichanthelium oligosanthes TaxID=888268 RepID=A0A1E5VSS8_9POAL|nr:Peroxidase N [Dichanthelium oligosanthes]